MTTTMERDAANAEPRSPRSANRRTVAIVAAATVLVAVVLVWLVAFSSVFGVRTVRVDGLHVLTTAQVTAAADVSHGTPLVRVDTAAATRRIERLPEVASAEVSTSFPSTLVIRITEREPVGFIRQGGSAVLVDRTGDQYRTVDHAPAGLPRFVVPGGTDARTTGGAVATAAAALPAALRREVRSVEALDPSAITLVLTRDRVVAWGSAQRSPEKARVLAALLGQKHGRDYARHFDVTDPDQPFTR